MSTIAHGVDALACYLTGGSSNTDPDASLGGAISSRRVLGQGFPLTSPIPGVRIDHVFAANGEGDGELSVDANGDLVWTPPGDTAGDPVTIAAGDSAIVSGEDESKAVRVYRESGLRFSGISTVGCVASMNGVLGQADLTSAQRAAGRTTCRAFALKAQGPYPVAGIRLSFPSVSGAQATWTIAAETPVAGAVQSVVSESTAPTGLSFASTLYVPAISAGSWVGVWIKRVWPVSGTVAARELVDLAVSYYGA